MNIFDIVGPVMVGPSSSHTAGAVKIGYVARKLMAQPVKRAEILLYGSFLATGKGHGTRFAIVAGLLGMRPDDSRIPDSFRLAEEAGMELFFGEADLKEAHPNSVQLKLTGIDGREMELVGESLGGSIINIASIDGSAANFSGALPTLMVYHVDRPGLVAEVAGMLAQKPVNIAAMKLYRSSRGGDAVMVLECDYEVSEEVIDRLRHLEAVKKVTYYSLEERNEMTWVL